MKQGTSPIPAALATNKDLIHTSIIDILLTSYKTEVGIKCPLCIAVSVGDLPCFILNF